MCMLQSKVLEPVWASMKNSVGSAVCRGFSIDDGKVGRVGR